MGTVSITERHDFVTNGDLVWDSGRRFCIYRRGDRLLCLDWLSPDTSVVVPTAAVSLPAVLGGTLSRAVLARFFPPLIDTSPVVIGVRPRDGDDDQFWQYPCATERQAYDNHLGIRVGANIDLGTRVIHTYLGLPWATYIDRARFPKEILTWLQPRLQGCARFAAQQGYALAVHTVCQHIYWRRLLGRFRDLGVTDLHLSHCEQGQDGERAGLGLRIHSWPLIAVNVEDGGRAIGLERGKPMAQRRYLASFIGAYLPHYRSDVRLQLLAAARDDSSEDVIVEVGNEWHFEQTVYQEQVANRPIDALGCAAQAAAARRYNEVLSDSVFSLCPEGAGPNTLRVWESLAVGAIPVILAEQWQPPEVLVRAASTCCLFVTPHQLGTLFAQLRQMPPEQRASMSAAGLEVYSRARTLCTYVPVVPILDEVPMSSMNSTPSPATPAAVEVPAAVGDGRVTGARPLVSVVMPSLNQARYIESAVRSVLEQGVPGLELIVADGGSVDGTQGLLAELQRHFGPGLRWHSEPDGGPANAVNKAMALARGEFLGWLNSDDLYVAGAIARAIDYFAANPAAVMVYGEGEHIDAAGHQLGRYPTRPPEVTVAGFQAGCFICQPTVFIRRSAWVAVGPLDESLATAFDFDLWVRFFRRFPDRIGHLDQVQAHSRLHPDCITGTQRRLVAQEAVRLLARHLGKADDHWLRTHIEEVLAAYRDGDVRGDLREYVSEFVTTLESCLEPRAVQQLRDDLQADARLGLALPGVYADVYPDGWAPRSLLVRLAKWPAGALLRLRCAHHWPTYAPLELRLCPSWRGESRVRVSAPGPFTLDIGLAGAPPGVSATVRIIAEHVFVPAFGPQPSDDRRELAFILCGLELL